MEPTVLRHPANRRRVLQASAATAFAFAMGSKALRARAQGVELSREFEGSTLNLLMEDLLETTAIEEMLPEFTEATGINVNFEKVNYGVMREKLVPQLAAGEGNGSYDVLEVDFYWIAEFARSGWMQKLDELIANSNGALNLDNYIPATLKIGSEVDGSVYYIPMYPYPMGLIYRTDLLENADFAAAYKTVAGKDLALPTSVADYVAMATAVSQSGQDIYGAAMQAQQVDPIVMEFCNFLYGAGGDFYNAEMTEPIINQELGVSIA
ncbi:MAG: extracellular solute-binding protein, partial [Chloroflexota bacterium]